jgi:hypothetical protein
MIHYSDEAIVEGLRLRSDYIISFVYRSIPIDQYLVNEILVRMRTQRMFFRMSHNLV